MAIGAGLAAGSILTLGASMLAPGSALAQAAAGGIGAFIGLGPVSKKNPDMGLAIATGAVAPLAQTILTAQLAPLMAKLRPATQAGFEQLPLGSVSYDNMGRLEEPSLRGMGAVAYDNMGAVVDEYDYADVYG